MKLTLLAICLALSVASASHAQDVTPDPAIEVNAARAELGKRRF